VGSERCQERERSGAQSQRFAMGRPLGLDKSPRTQVVHRACYEEVYIHVKTRLE
jgi:hypothetical protein